MICDHGGAVEIDDCADTDIVLRLIDKSGNMRVVRLTITEAARFHDQFYSALGRASNRTETQT